ncbi:MULTISPECIES: formimidoylglutamase [unclassified Myroides]|uniref:formimidoylglutamase n=1 Tax=unclassified Myroides TaxID=2642485 RepID=UPI003D2F6F28
MLELLRPVSVEFRNYIDGLPSQSLGKKVHFHSGGDFDKYSQYKIALIGVTDNRGLESEVDTVDLLKVRKSFYTLFPGNWHVRIVDLGDIMPGDTMEDTYFLLGAVVEDLVKNGVIPVVIGGSQDLTYAMYRGYDKLEQMVNLVCIDHKLDVAKDGGCAAESFISRIILEEPNNLFNFSNLGYQTYYNSQEEIDLIENLFFEAYRVGEIINNIALSEPVLRDADIVSVDINAVKSSDSGNFSTFNPNGFDGREICSLARYSGLSDKVSTFGIFNYNNQINETLLLGQVLWYFIEGVNYRYNEYPFACKENYIKYIVPFDDYENLVFYKSDISGRWWIEVNVGASVNEKLTKRTLLPCSYEDYENATAQQLPDRWWRAFKKSLV